MGMHLLSFCYLFVFVVLLCSFLLSPSGLMIFFSGMLVFLSHWFCILIVRFWFVVIVNSYILILQFLCFDFYTSLFKLSHSLYQWDFPLCIISYFLLHFLSHFLEDQLQFSSVQSLSHVRLFVAPWIAACQASLSITNSRSSPKLLSIESVMPSSHLILCCPLLLLPPTPPSIRIFSNGWISLQFKDFSGDEGF